MRVLDYALAADGGTKVTVLELDYGEKLMIGLDGSRSIYAMRSGSVGPIGS